MIAMLVGDSRGNLLQLREWLGYGVEIACRTLHNLDLALDAAGCQHFDLVVDDHNSAADGPVGVRIVAVADAFDAMTTERPYKEAMSPDAALDETVVERGRHFGPRCVDAFAASYRRLHPPNLATAARYRLGPLMPFVRAAHA